ncbi:MAG: peptidoglycan DD-metalloendopeptidase family protein [Rhodobacteraceae bacterium]|nr:peptidoglycan DD-metalloendopeptidase family protein [Paracoccaceae bacterium]
MVLRTTHARNAVLAGFGLAVLAACDGNGNFDPDIRRFGGTNLDTSAAAAQIGQGRPAADARGIIAYPGYQIAVARRGDTVSSVAARIGMSPEELGGYNAIAPNAPLREGEVLALPRRVAEPSPSTGGSAGAIDVTAIASGAIDRAGATQPSTAATGGGIGPTEPIRHRVSRGETAYTVARLYGVDVKALADWNGLGPDLEVREGQTLLIPIAALPAAASAVTAPGAGSPTPVPPSAAKPLPDEKTAPVAEAAPLPAAPDMGADRTTASGASQLAMPVSGKIVRGYKKGKNEGIDIAAAAGTAVSAAGDGIVAAITKDTNQVPILVIRHGDPSDKNALLTVYARISGVSVAKGDRVKRGQKIATVAAGDPAVLHFEVRKGFDSVDPLPFLQ